MNMEYQSWTTISAAHVGSGIDLYLSITQATFLVYFQKSYFARSS
jgi:hypothetical protein